MIKKISIMMLIISCQQIFSQMGINTATPDSSAIFDIVSHKGGVLIPRMTEAQRNAIPSPAEGLEVYATDKGAKYYFDGTSWTRTNKILFTTLTQIYSFSDAITPSGAGSDGVTNLFGSLVQTYKSFDADFANRLDANTIEITQPGKYFIELTGFMKRTGTNTGAQISGITQILKNGILIGESYSVIGAFPTATSNANTMCYSLVEDLVAGDRIMVNYQKTDAVANDSNALGFYETMLIIRK